MDKFRKGDLAHCTSGDPTMKMTHTMCSQLGQWWAEMAPKELPGLLHVNGLRTWMEVRGTEAEYDIRPRALEFAARLVVDPDKESPDLPPSVPKEFNVSFLVPKILLAGKSRQEAEGAARHHICILMPFRVREAHEPGLK
jgi:hypothetical protein